MFYFTCINIWRCVATSFSWLYMLLLRYHSFAIVVVVKNKKNEWPKFLNSNPYCKTNLNLSQTLIADLDP